MAKKMIAVILAIAVCFTMVLSAGVVRHNADHDCVGSGCQVCQQMDSARQSFKTLASGLLFLALALALVYGACQFVDGVAQHLLQGTLVALKVKLLN